jgi:murein DD-endopeptidase MepM/ murein hydrolase activator NlpD
MILEYPVKNPIVEQEFGRDTKDDPIYSKFYELFDYKHPGVDFELSIGTEVYASFPGVVVRVENHKGMGNVVSVRNGNILALYAHLSEINVSLGQVVNEGQLIGLSGKTGEACPTPHLHFELRDLSKNLLKDMVFEPIFNFEVQNYSTTFTYTVNNLNTTKNLSLLAERYFGNQNMWTKIKETNKLSINEFETLPDGLEIIIPNYKQM